MSVSTITRVIKSIAATTRYPTELLTPDADLENDLGIDSVKRLEIVMGLGEEFDIRLDSERRNPDIRTIRDVASWVDSLIDQTRADRQTPLSAPRQADAANNRNGASHLTHHAHSAPVSGPHFTPSPLSPSGNGYQVNGAKSGASAKTGPYDRQHDGSLGVAFNKPLDGRIALVTGSGRGVGRTIARLLASRGATVIVNSFHSRDQGDQTVAEIVDFGGAAIHLWGSVANPAHVEQIFSQIDQQFGRLDILVCNASDGRIGPFLDLTAEDWDRAFRTNVSGHHHCAVKAAPLMRSGGGGSIITLSAVGSSGYISGLGSQGVVKAAVETMTRYLACELGPLGIRVNCVVGGPVYGDLLSKFPHSLSTQNHWESLTPDGELCDPIDLANTIAFLVSDDARGVNGAVWMVDHGFSSIADGRPLGFAQRERFAQREQMAAGPQPIVSRQATGRDHMRDQMNVGQ
jgi:enoyl-[acyl-carrier protein] reductase III